MRGRVGVRVGGEWRADAPEWTSQCETTGGVITKQECRAYEK